MIDLKEIQALIQSIGGAPNAIAYTIISYFVFKLATWASIGWLVKSIAFRFFDEIGRPQKTVCEDCRKIRRAENARCTDHG